ncbi:MAG: hypothetical protein ACKE5M_07130 [Methylophilaceae bacterium]
MKKLSSMNKARVSSKAKEHLSKEKIICLAITVLLMIIIANEQIRLALLNW